MEDKTNKYILGIVAIVAIVGIIIMVISSINTTNNNQYEDSTGYATKVATSASNKWNNNTNSSTNNTCTDSDKGYTYDVRGTISGIQNGKQYKNTDYCIGTTELKEYACSNNLPTSANYKCASGCKDGACLKNQTNQTYNIITSDIKAITTGGTVLENTFNTELEVKIRPEISNIGAASLFITSSSIKYTISLNGNILASNIPCGQINTYLYPGQTILCNAYNVTQLSYAGTYNISIHSDSDNMYQNENNNDNTRTETFTVIANYTCTDSDGGLNYNTPGYVFISGIEEITWDQCISSSTLNETYCNGNDLGTTYYSCPNGCYDGACITIPINNTCTDSDGGWNYYTLGNVSGTYSSGTPYTYLDYCMTSSPNTIVEYNCYSNQPITNSYNCTHGCGNGRCLTINNTCTDSDGGLNYNLTGTVTGNYLGVPYTYTDYCSPYNNNSVREYACTNNTYTMTIHQCDSETCLNGSCVNY